VAWEQEIKNVDVHMGTRDAIVVPKEQEQRSQHLKERGQPQAREENKLYVKNMQMKCAIIG
jgi:hypothetical protein